MLYTVNTKRRFLRSLIFFSFLLSYYPQYTPCHIIIHNIYIWNCSEVEICSVLWKKCDLFLSFYSDDGSHAGSDADRWKETFSQNLFLSSPIIGNFLYTHGHTHRYEQNSFYFTNRFIPFPLFFPFGWNGRWNVTRVEDVCTTLTTTATYV